MTVRCGTKEGGSQADVDGIVGFAPTDTPASKCIEACLGEASGVVSQFLNHNLLELNSVLNKLFLHNQDQGQSN